MRFRSFFLLGVFLGAAHAHGQQTQPAPRHDPDEGTLSSIKPQIPEPVVFDLVRPLGAERGEFEVNSLFRVPVEGAGTRLVRLCCPACVSRLERAPERYFALIDEASARCEMERAISSGRD